VTATHSSQPEIRPDDLDPGKPGKKKQAGKPCRQDDPDCGNEVEPEETLPDECREGDAECEEEAEPDSGDEATTGREARVTEPSSKETRVEESPAEQPRGRREKDKAARRAARYLSGSVYSLHPADTETLLELEGGRVQLAGGGAVSRWMRSKRPERGRVANGDTARITNVLAESTGETGSAGGEAYYPCRITIQVEITLVGGEKVRVETWWDLLYRESGDHLQQTGEVVGALVLAAVESGKKTVSIPGAELEIVKVDKKKGQARVTVLRVAGEVYLPKVGGELERAEPKKVVTVALP